MYKESIGIVGGFGAYATLGFYQRLLEEFASDCERNYPHIYMDNDFTMPSRTRALLYGEGYLEIVNMITESLKKMCLWGVDYIILVCGTAHAFLPDVYKLVPDAKNRVLNLIEILGNYMDEVGCYEALIVAAEGTLKNKIYESAVGEKIKLINPGETNYREIRYFIEAVKRNQIDKETYNRWTAFLEKMKCKNVVLGCTEFPMLIDRLRKFDTKNWMSTFTFFDPLEIVLQELKQIIK